MHINIGMKLPITCDVLLVVANELYFRQTTTTEKVSTQEVSLPIVTLTCCYGRLLLI